MTSISKDTLYTGGIVPQQGSNCIRISIQIVVPDYHLATSAAIDESKHCRGAFGLTALAPFRYRWNEAASKHKAGKIIACVRHFADHCPLGSSAVRRSKTTSCDMAHVHQRYMYDIFSFLHAKFIRGNDNDVFVSLH